MSRMKSSQGIICCGGSKSQPQKYKGGDDKEDQCATSIDSYRPIVCDNLKLVQIQVVFRHGARTPLNFIRGLDEATYDASLEDELQETDFDLEVVKFADGSPAGKSTMEPDLRAKKLKGGAHASILTTVGQKQMYDLGVLLRDWYLPILHVSRFSTHDVYVRSSHVERTIKSVRCLLAGMFGKDHLNEVGKEGTRTHI
ncbi:unnamed protein product [Lymnaea stagnalis]|uniref:Uncharacterized protein n=1 Tax=Lymnaea stagnalis TaxID=6523 RepID=A0AAV2HQ60_LYMST